MSEITEIHRGKEVHRAHYIPEWAEKRGLRQKDFVKELGISKSMASRWFKEGVFPERENLERIAHLLQLDDPGMLLRHPDDDWMAALLKRNKAEAEALRDVLADRSTDELRRMIATLQAAFPRDGTNG